MGSKYEVPDIVYVHAPSDVTMPVWFNEPTGNASKCVRADKLAKVREEIVAATGALIFEDTMAAEAWLKQALAILDELGVE